MHQPLTLDMIREAHARIRHVAIVTPLLQVRPGLVPDALFLKCENLQRTGAFKIRGACNMMMKLASAEPDCRGAITYSSGNHGLAVAYAAKLLGLHAVVVMPVSASTVKVEGARQLGAEVIFEGRTSIERKARAEAEASARGLAIVPPFDHPDIMAGQGTIGLEIAEQCPDVGTVFVQVSGGGLISGIATAIKSLKPDVRIVAVEPEGAPKISASRREGRPVTLERTSSIADGLLAVRPGDLTFPIIEELVDEVDTVGDAAIRSAVAWLFREMKLVAEPSGAITVAAVLARAEKEGGAGGGRPVVALLSGGNVAPEDYCKYLAG
jgi:threonine dehydratase